MKKKLKITTNSLESGYKQMAADKEREQEALEWSAALGFLFGEGSIPDDFDHMGKAEIEKQFSGES